MPRGVPRQTWRQYSAGQATPVHRLSLQRGFTLLELLIVVMILGILAGIVMPKLITPTEDAKTSALETNLAIMNKAIEIYHLQHGGTYPGMIASEITWDNFVQQMTLPTNKEGEPGDDYGPYLRTGIPSNPFTGTRLGVIYDRIIPTDMTIAWFYDADRGMVYGRGAGGDVATFEIEDAVPQQDHFHN